MRGKRFLLAKRISCFSSTWRYVVSCVSVEKKFLWRRSLLLTFSPHYDSFKCISSHFRGLEFKSFPGEYTPGPPSCLVENCLQFSLRQPKLYFPPPTPRRDLPLRPHLTRLLVGLHLPVKNLATGLALYYKWKWGSFFQ